MLMNYSALLYFVCFPVYFFAQSGNITSIGSTNRMIVIDYPASQLRPLSETEFLSGTFKVNRENTSVNSMSQVKMRFAEEGELTSSRVDTRNINTIIGAAVPMNNSSNIKSSFKHTEETESNLGSCTYGPIFITIRAEAKKISSE